MRGVGGILVRLKRAACCVMFQSAMRARGEARCQARTVDARGGALEIPATTIPQQYELTNLFGRDSELMASQWEDDLCVVSNSQRICLVGMRNLGSDPAMMVFWMPISTS